MYRLRLLATAALATAFLIGSISLAAPASADAEKVWICHHTESDTNPYVLIHVSVSSVEHGKGHTDHNGHDLDIIGVDPESGCPSGGED
ncbi:MAG TPA: hypothetical protein VI759_08805 [Dehalococcoidia bacterium]|nr:hypothetical protein [Dehalococcoidia bacterium]